MCSPHFLLCMDLSGHLGDVARPLFSELLNRREVSVCTVGRAVPLFAILLPAGWK